MAPPKHDAERTNNCCILSALKDIINDPDNEVAMSIANASLVETGPHGDEGTEASFRCHKIGCAAVCYFVSWHDEQTHKGGSYIVEPSIFLKNEIVDKESQGAEKN